MKGLPGIELVQDLQQPSRLDIGIGSAYAVTYVLLHEPDNNCFASIASD